MFTFVRFDIFGICLKSRSATRVDCNYDDVTETAKSDVLLLYSRDRRSLLLIVDHNEWK